MTGKERRDYLLGLGSSLAAFGSLIGRISTCVEMYFENCMVPLKLHSEILHAVSRTLSYLLVCLLICLFIFFLNICQSLIFKTDHLENSLDTMAFRVFKAQWDSSAATQPLFPLKSDTEKKKQKPSLSWCT